MLLPLKIKDSKPINMDVRERQWFVKETISLPVLCLSAQIQKQVSDANFRLQKEKKEVLINSEILKKKYELNIFSHKASVTNKDRGFTYWLVWNGGNIVLQTCDTQAKFFQTCGSFIARAAAPNTRAHARSVHAHSHSCRADPSQAST